MAENAMGVTEMWAATCRGRSLCAPSGQQDLWRHDSHVVSRDSIVAVYQYLTAVFGVPGRERDINK